MDEIAALCSDVTLAVSDAIQGLVGTVKGNRIVGMGADGTPSKLIDIAAEDAALEILGSSGIDMKIVTEEKGHLTFGDEPRFTVVLDPLDGTYNATHDLPFYAVSIAIGDNDLSDIKYGKVFNLANNMDFIASRGGGTFCNGRAVHVSAVAKLEEFTVAAYGYRNGEDTLKRLSKKVRRIRSFGSASLELCYVASGRFDAFIDMRNRMRVTDVAAGFLIIKEAGGVVTDGHGNPFSGELDVTSRINFVASNGNAHTSLEKTIVL